VVAEKSLLPLRRQTSPSQHVFRNRRLGDIKAELEQLAVNPRRAPKRIFLAHTAHEINPGPAAWIVRFPTPPGAKTHPVPANDCLRTHDRRGVADIGETPIQPDEQRPITAGKPQPFRSLSMQNVQLMAKDENFGFQSFMNESSPAYIRAKVRRRSPSVSIMIRFSFLLRIQRMRFSEGTRRSTLISQPSSMVIDSGWSTDCHFNLMRFQKGGGNPC